MSNSDLAAKAESLLRLHHQPTPLVLCNVWDATSARIVESAGYQAVATTSSGIANSLGYPDGQVVPTEMMMEAVGRITRVVNVPVTADLEAGYGDVAGTTNAALDAGAVGLNFEDYVGGAMVPFKEQVEGIRTIRRVGESRGVHIVINARTDIYLQKVGAEETRFEAAVERALAYREAGADCIFVPYAVDKDTIAALVKAIPLPLNILATKGCPSIAWLTEAGVRRVSVGGGAMRACMGLTKIVAESLLRDGTYECYTDVLMPASEANQLFARR